MTKYLYLLILTLLSGCGFVAIELNHTPLSVFPLTPGITSSVDLISRQVTLTGVPAGNIQSFLIASYGRPVSNLSCADLGTSGVVNGSGLYYDLGIKTSSGTISIPCTASETGDFNVSLSYTPSEVANVSTSMTFLNTSMLDSAYFKSSQSPWMIFTSIRNAANISTPVVPWTVGNGFAQVVVAQNTQTNERVVVSSRDGTNLTELSTLVVTYIISPNGRYAYFTGRYSSLVTGANVNLTQLYRKDLSNPALPPVMLSSSNILATDQTATQASTGVSNVVAVSSNNRYVVFVSDAPNLCASTCTGFQVYRVDTEDLSLPPLIVSSLDSTQSNQTGLSLPSATAAISEDGQYIAFTSSATTLCGGTCSGIQVYRKDMNSLATPPVIVSSLDSTQANQAAYQGNGNNLSTVVINSTGRYISFTNKSTNFYAGLNGSFDQVFIKDMDNLATPPVIMSSKDSTQADQTGYRCASLCTAHSISANGRYIFFSGAATLLVTGDGTDNQIYRKDRTAPASPPILVSSLDYAQADQTNYRANGYVTFTTSSDDGNEVSFSGRVTNLATTLTNHYVTLTKNLTVSNSALSILAPFDINFWTTPVDYAFGYAFPAVNLGSVVTQLDTLNMSGDGNYVVFPSTVAFYPGLIPAAASWIYRKNLADRRAPIEIVSTTDATQTNQSAVAFTGTSTTTNSNGRYVIFGSTSIAAGADGAIEQIFIKDMNISGANPPTMVTTSNGNTATKGNALSRYPSVDDSGMLIVFESSATNWVTGSANSQIYLKNMASPTSAPVLISSLDSTQSDQTNYQGNGNSIRPRISRDGRYVVFSSVATNFYSCAPACVAATQIYRKDLQNLNQPPVLVSSLNYAAANQTALLGTAAGLGNALTNNTPDLSGDGRYVVFVSSSSGAYCTGCTGQQAYLRDMNTASVPQMILISSIDSSQADQTTYRGGGLTFNVRISSNGSRVFFASRSVNLLSPLTLINAGLKNYYKDISTLSNPNRLLTTVYQNGVATTYEPSGQGYAQIIISADGRYVLQGGQHGKSLPFIATSYGQLILKDLNNLIP